MNDLSILEILKIKCFFNVFKLNNPRKLQKNVVPINKYNNKYFLKINRIQLNVKKPFKINLNSTSDCESKYHY